MGRPKKGDVEKKLALLETIRAKKSVLFGQFSSDVEKLTIEAAWEEVLLHAKSLTLVTDIRDSTYVRKLFSQWKSRTLEKKDNRMRTGTGGGKSCKLTEVDQLILDIVGKDSPVVEGLPVGESGNYDEGEVASTHDVIFDEDEVEDAARSPSREKQVPSCSKSMNKSPDVAPTSGFRIPTKKRKLAPPTEKELLLGEKWKAQAEYLKQQAYNVKLQNYKLEVELGIPHSDLTAGLQQF